MILVEEYSPEKDEVTFCETVVEAAEIMPIMLANQVIKIRKGEELENALPLRSIQRLKFDKGEGKKDQSG